MCDIPWWLQIIHEIEKAMPTVGIVAAGIWTYRRFGLRRESATSIELDLKWECSPYDSKNYLVTLHPILTNKSSVKVTAIKNIRPSYEDETEKIMFSADLQILPLPPNIPKLQSLVFSEIKKFPEYPGIEINLLDDYEVDGKIKFYLEPNDTYHLTTPIVLSKGLYIATLTFLGKKYKEEFWRRRFVFKVPSNSGTNATA